MRRRLDPNPEVHREQRGSRGVAVTSETASRPTVPLVTTSHNLIPAKRSSPNPSTPATTQTISRRPPTNSLTLPTRGMGRLRGSSVGLGSGGGARPIAERYATRPEDDNASVPSSQE